MITAKIAIFLLVVWGLWHAIDGAREEFAANKFSLSDLAPGWLLLAAGLYLVGMLPMGLFWFAVMRSLGQKPKLGETLRAFYIGHLGKYVPGKALVVVLRTGFIRSDRVDTTIAATSIFVETLTMMAVGAFLAAGLMAIFFSQQTELLLLAIVLMACAGVPTLPPIFRRVVRWLKVSKANPQLDKALEGLSWRLMLGGWVGNLVGWFFLGLSLWATLKAIPQAAVAIDEMALVLPLVVASVALAMVAGFLSLLPGGIGVREYVLIQLMASDFGTVVPIVSALVLRLVWLVAEVVLSIILYGSAKRSQNRSQSMIESNASNP